MVRQIYYKELAHEVMEAGRFKNLQGGPVVQETRENWFESHQVEKASVADEIWRLPDDKFLRTQGRLVLCSIQAFNWLNKAHPQMESNLFSSSPLI